MENKTCYECEHYGICIQLCPHAELVAKQDYVALQEHNVVENTEELIPPKDYPQLKAEIHLTPTEKKLLRCMYDGLTAKDIAYLLEISINTVYVYKSNLKKKYKNY